MNQSPLSELLEHLDVSAQEAAVLGGCSPAAISQARSGAAPIPKGLLLALARTHVVNVADLERRQAEWKAARQSSIAARVVAGRGGSIPARSDLEASVVSRMAAGAVTK